MNQCSCCHQRIQMLRKQLQYKDQELQRQKALHSQDIKLHEEQVRSFHRRQENFKTLNKTLTEAFQTYGGSSDFLRASKLQISRNSNQKSCSNLSTFSREKSFKTLRASPMRKIVPFDQKQNRRTNYKGKRQDLLEAELLQAKGMQKMLKQQNKMLRNEVRELSLKLEKYKELLWIGQKDSELGLSRIQNQQTLSQFFDTGLRKAMQSPKKERKRELNLIGCSFCGQQFRPVQFMSHLQNCK